MPLVGLTQTAFVVDCDCGVQLEGTDRTELLEELLEHAADVHETPLADPRDLLARAHEQ